MPATKPRPARRSPRWRRRKEDRPDEILQAALDVFVTRGYAAARLEEVGRRAGVSKGTIYLYFPGKAALFKAVVRRSIVPLVERAEAAAAAHSGPVADVLRQLVEGVWEAVGESKISGLPKLIMAEAANFPELARFYHGEVAGRVIGLLAGLIQRGVSRGEFRPVEPLPTAMAVLGPVVFAVIWKHSLYPYAGVEFDFRRYIALHVENLLRGLAGHHDQDVVHA